MAITIVATVGAANANSFVTEAEAITRAESRLNRPATWTTLAGAVCTDTEKTALIEAGRELNILWFNGTRVNAVQVLVWPRAFCIDPDSPLALGTPTIVGYPYYETTVIPRRVKDAQIELAFEFLKAGTTDLAAHDTTLDVRRKQIDVLETEYFDAGQRAQGLGRFPRVINLLEPLLDPAHMGGLPVVRT